MLGPGGAFVVEGAEQVTGVFRLSGQELLGDLAGAAAGVRSRRISCAVTLLGSSRPGSGSPSQHPGRWHS
ncbi:hypothetical protein N7U49_22215 [Streptomyces sp. AD2-2]|nr:hypothetical protein N7U49_22215 [Streptomyces sp. AD2-2]